jgi:hypothetical protein
MNVIDVERPLYINPLEFVHVFVKRVRCCILGLWRGLRPLFARSRS